MSARADMDRQNVKPAEAKAAMVEMVRITAEEQRRCRIEGFKMAVRFARTLNPVLAERMVDYGLSRWAEGGFDV